MARSGLPIYLIVWMIIFEIKIGGFMRIAFLFTIYVGAFLLLISVAPVSAQNTLQGAGASAEADPTPAADRKPNLLSQLGLSRDQIQQIRKLNIERKPLMQAAQFRVRDANRLLDEAIYADSTNDTDIDARIKELQSAQASLIAIRSSNELAVRRLLSPDQLLRFRDLRSRFEQMLKDRRKAERGGSNDPRNSRPLRNGSQRPI